MDQQFWLNRYEELKRWIRPYLGGQIRLDEIDPFVIWAFIDIRNFKKESFIILDRKNRYVFHIPSGYLLHIFAPYWDRITKPKFGFSIIKRVDRLEPGRRIVYAERKIPGPRGGKLFAVGSATHITTNLKEISNPLTKRHLLKLKYHFTKETPYRWPNIYEIEKRMWFKPFKHYFKLAVQKLWPES